MLAVGRGVARGHRGVMRRAQRAWLFASVVAIGCAHAPPSPPPVPPAPPPAPRLKLAVLPVDGRDFPSVAQSLNNVLRDVRVKGVDDYFVSKATLEVVQLSIECVEPTSACHRAVGKQLGANKLLMGHVTAAGKKRHDKSVRVTLTLFDVDAGEAAGVVDRVYRSPDEASQGATELVAQATSDPPRSLMPDAPRSMAREER